MRTRRTATLIVIVIGVLALGAGAGAQAGRNADAGRQYLALVKPVDATYAAIRQHSGGWIGTSCSGTTCYSTAEQPVIAALERWRRGLERDRWPTSARTHVRGLVVSIGAEVSELQATGQPNSATWSTALQRDEHAVIASANRLRGDLGLRATVSL